MKVTPMTVKIYFSSSGELPFLSWLESLRDERAKAAVKARIARIRLGNFGFVRPVGEGVHELKIDFGPGYRVYFGVSGKELVILLCAGDKGTQNEDIKKARIYWKDYKERESHVRN